MKDIRGKYAVLTGGSKGLGPHIARALADEGVNLALAARSRELLEQTAEEIRARGVRVLAVPADVTDDESVENMLAEVRSDFGRIDILINNAGVEWVLAYKDLTPGDIRRMMTTNIVAPMLLTRRILPEMLARGDGQVVTMSSLGGKKGSPYSATYAAAKAGLIEWSRGLREELRESGVGVSVVCPGFVAQAGMFAVYGKKAPRLVGQTTPDKVAAAVVRAIKKNVGETIVNPAPIRPMLFLDAIHPAITAAILRKGGVYAFYRQQAEDNQRPRKA